MAVVPGDDDEDNDDDDDGGGGESFRRRCPAWGVPVVDDDGPEVVWPVRQLMSVTADKALRSS